MAKAVAVSAEPAPTPALEAKPMVPLLVTVAERLLLPRPVAWTCCTTPPVILDVALSAPAAPGVAVASTLTVPELTIVPDPVVATSGPLAEKTNCLIAGEPVSPPVPTEASTVPVPVAAALTSTVPLLFIRPVAERLLVSTEAVWAIPPLTVALAGPSEDTAIALTPTVPVFTSEALAFQVASSASGSRCFWVMPV